MVKAEELAFFYSPAAPVLENVSFHVQPGRIAAIAGRNGAGKSTLLRLCNALLKPVAGRLLVNGIDTRATSASKLARHVATVFQIPEQQIFASRVVDEISFGPKQLGYSRTQMEEAVVSAMERTGLSPLAESHPLDLSHAGRRFVALASALAMTPRLLLLDEPQQGLDAAAMRKLENILRAEKAAGVTILFTCHDMDFIARNADDLLVLAGGRLLRSDPVSDAFSDEALIQRAGLKLPDPMKMAQMLHLTVALSCEQLIALWLAANVNFPIP
jgi:energy-coupling factor transport system ATP-binding protein